MLIIQQRLCLGWHKVRRHKPLLVLQEVELLVVDLVMVMVLILQNRVVDLVCLSRHTLGKGVSNTFM